MKHHRANQAKEFPCFLKCMQVFLRLAMSYKGMTHRCHLAPYHKMILLEPMHLSITFGDCLHTSITVFTREDDKSFIEEAPMLFFFETCQYFPGRFSVRRVRMVKLTARVL